MRTQPRIKWVLPPGYEPIEVDPGKLSPEPWNAEHLEQLRNRFRIGGNIETPILDIAMDRLYIAHGDHCIKVAQERGEPTIQIGVRPEIKNQILTLLRTQKAA